MKNVSPAEEQIEGRHSLPTAVCVTASPASPLNTCCRYTVVAGALGAIAIALGGVLSYLPGWRTLGSIRPDYVPMAPSTAVCFILLAAVLLVMTSRSMTAMRFALMLLPVLLVTLFSALEVSGFLAGRDLSFEDQLVPNFGYLGEIPIARMSPATGAFFFLAGLAAAALLLRVRVHKRTVLYGGWGGSLGGLVLGGALVVCLSYFYDSPLLYGQGSTVPMALTTALAFLLLGGAIIAAAGEKCLPLRLFIGVRRAGKPLSARKRLVLLVVVMVGACAMVIMVMTSVLYRYQLQAQSQRLHAAAKNQAHLIEVIFQESIAETQTRAVDDTPTAVLQRIVDSYSRYRQFDETGGGALAQRDGDAIVFFLHDRFDNGKRTVMTIAFDAEPAEPMRRALLGETGSLIGRDYRGETVLAGYAPVAAMNLGLVETIDLQYIRAPFIRSGFLAGVFALLIIFSGTLLFYYIGKPVVERLEAYSRELEREIDARRQADADLVRLNLLLAANNKELEQMVYVASHDLRSPLVNISGFSTLLERAFGELRTAFNRYRVPEEEVASVTPLLEQEIPDALRFIRTSAVKMDTLIAGLLKLSRSRRAVPVVTNLDMDALLSQVVEEFSFQIKAAGAEIELAPLPSCRGDVDQLGQVFSNLLNNALKYLDPERPGRIRISGCVEGKQVIYCVEDNGIGIDRAHQKSIFEIFHRLDPAASEGEGLGLNIVQQALENLSGTVRVESQPGVGSRFYLTLPAALKKQQQEGDSKCKKKP